MSTESNQMISNNNGWSIPERRAALVAGIGYIFILFPAIFANFFVKEGLIVSGDVAATARNITGSIGLFRAGIVSFLVVFLIDIFIAWGLYIVFRNSNRDVSLLAAWLRIVYAVFLGVALVFYFQALQYYQVGEFANAIVREERNILAMVALESFNSTWLIGLTAFGLHLVVIGSLIIRRGPGPKILGYFLVIAGAAYMLDTIAHTVLHNYADYAAIFVVMVSLPSVIGELWFGFWLLFKVGRKS